MTNFKVAIIGGSGFYQFDGLENAHFVDVDTEFGKPSDPPLEGTFNGVPCVVLARHGVDHRFNPTDVNYRANIRALQKLGVTHILAASACGSLREEIRPGDFVILDSFIDRTTKRHQTFFEQGSGPDFGTVCHIPMSPAFCEKTRQVLIGTAKDLHLPAHDKGTVVTIEGPRFSTKAESHMYQMWGADLVGMTTVPEVILAKEAGISYASVGIVSDYDCWRNDTEAVDVEAVMEVMRKCISSVKKLFAETLKNMSQKDWTEVIQENKDVVKRNVMYPKQQ